MTLSSYFLRVGFVLLNFGESVYMYWRGLFGIAVFTSVLRQKCVAFIGGGFVDSEKWSGCSYRNLHLRCIVGEKCIAVPLLDL